MSYHRRRLSNEVYIGVPFQRVGLGLDDFFCDSSNLCARRICKKFLDESRTSLKFLTLK